jgi:acyl-CoA thioesterase-1
MKHLICLTLISITCACGTSDSKEKANTDTQKSDTTQSTMNQKQTARKYILCFGNSLTAGYGLEEEESFPSLIQQRIDSLGLPYQVINAGLSGETSAGGLGRIDWVLRQQIDVFVLELGPNDVLRGLDLDATEKNLRGILDRVLSKYPDIPIVIAGMEAPPNMGEAYTTQFRGIYRKLATDYKARLIPFLLEGVGGKPELNLPDRMHPNAEGQKIVRENVWIILKDVL